MHQTVIIEEQLGTQPLRVLKDATTATVEIKHPQDLTLHVVFEEAEGMVIFDLQRPVTTIIPGVTDLPSGKPTEAPCTPYNGFTAMPHAIEVSGDGDEVFVMHGLCAGDTLTIGKGLKQGRAWVELAGVLPATPENCVVYSEAFGMKVTPHPVWGLPVVGVG